MGELHLDIIRDRLLREFKVEATATVDGDSISGEAKLGAFGTATFEGSRA